MSPYRGADSPDSTRVPGRHAHQTRRLRHQPLTIDTAILVGEKTCDREHHFVSQLLGRSLAALRRLQGDGHWRTDPYGHAWPAAQRSPPLGTIERQDLGSPDRHGENRYGRIAPDQQPYPRMRWLQCTSHAPRPLGKNPDQHPLMQEAFSMPQRLAIRPSAIDRKRAGLPHEPAYDRDTEEFPLGHEEDRAGKRGDDQDRIGIVQMIRRDERRPDTWHVFQPLDPKTDEETQKRHDENARRQEDPCLDLTAPREAPLRRNPIHGSHTRIARG